MSFVVKAVKSIAKAVIGVVKAVVKVVGSVIGTILGIGRKKGNAANNASLGRLSKNLSPEDFRKIIFGETAFATDLRFWEVHGTAFDRYSEIIAAAGHQVESFGAFYIEDDLVPFTGVNATGTFAGALSKTTNTGAAGNAAIACGAGTKWTSASKFTGVAHYALAWTVSDKLLPNGVPSRYTLVGKGARVYDPRRDSTNGGSGTHRVSDQTTWAYATLDGNSQPIGRNNALQLLWYLLGWRVTNPSTLDKLVVAGRGVDPADINWPEMIAAANDAEALQYYTDMILSTGDNHEDNESIISADGLLGEVLDPGGLWTYRITKDDTADVSVVLTEDDVVQGGDVSWVPESPVNDKFHEVAGTFIDPSVTSLYQAKAYPTVRDTSYITADGFRKRNTHNFQSVQDAGLAQKLARIKLNRTRFSGEFTATFNYRALKTSVWSIVQLSIDRYGFVNKLFRVVSQTISENGIEMVLREENSTIYTGGTVVVPAVPSTMAKYDIYQTVNMTATTYAAISSAAPDGSAVDGIRLTWGAVPNTVRRVEVQYKPAASSAWIAAGQFSNTTTTTDISPVLKATSYNVRARTWTIHEQEGTWSTGTVMSGSSGALAWSQMIGDGKPEDYSTTGDNLVKNGSFKAGSNAWVLDGGTVIPGSNASWYTAADTSWPSSGAFRTYLGSNVTVFLYANDKTFVSCVAMDKVFFSCDRYINSTGNADVYAFIFWYKSDGTPSSILTQDYRSFRDVPGWKRYVSTFDRPSDASFCYFGIYGNGSNGTMDAYFTNVRFGKTEAGSDITATAPVISQGSIAPVVPSNSFTYTSTTTSITLSWPAITLYRANGSSLAVSSGSIATTGLVASNTYYLYPYVVDPGGSGPVSLVLTNTGIGSTSGANQTVAQRTNALTLTIQRANIGLGSIAAATTASGTGGGGGGGSSCVWVSSFMPTGELAGNIKIGSPLCMLKDDDSGWFMGNTENVKQSSFMPCVRITTESGITLVVSASTPITSRNGVVHDVLTSTGVEVPTLDKGEFKWDVIKSIEDAGFREVVLISANNGTYAAGEFDDNRFIFTHNLTAKP